MAEEDAQPADAPRPPHGSSLHVDRGARRFAARGALVCSSQMLERLRWLVGWLSVAAFLAGGGVVVGGLAGCGGADQPKKAPATCPREKPPPPKQEWWWRKK
jgi:hypothetical protein